MNYACLEHSIDVKVGWEIKQRWEVASDIFPVLLTTTGYEGILPDHAKAPLVSTFDAQYKYMWKIMPYSVVSFNVRPNMKIDRLF